MSSDSRLQQAVIDELAWEPTVTAAHIGVSAHNGVITLTGHVPTFWEKQAAERAAKRVKGVRAVAEELEVELLGNPVDDERLAADALGRIAKDSCIPRDRIQIEVDKGHITLTGEVDWQYQKKAAEEAVERLPGVKWVTNRIALNPPSVAGNVREKIGKALERVAPFDVDGITVSNDSGKITLSGEVGSFYERDLIETTAWSVPGVVDVEDRIKIAL